MQGPVPDTLRPAPVRVSPPPIRRETRPDSASAWRRVPEPAAVPPEPAVPVLIQLSERERARLVEETNKDLAITNVCLERTDRARLSLEGKRTLADVQDLLQSVFKARGNNDIQAAARLARKARLLAEDLAGR